MQFQFGICTEFLTRLLLASEKSKQPKIKELAAVPTYDFLAVVIQLKYVMYKFNSHLKRDPHTPGERQSKWNEY